MLFRCWASVEDGGPTLKQHWATGSCPAHVCWLEAEMNFVPVPDNVECTHQQRTRWRKVVWTSSELAFDKQPRLPLMIGMYFFISVSEIIYTNIYNVCRILLGFCLFIFLFYFFSFAFSP